MFTAGAEASCVCREVKGKDVLDSELQLQYVWLGTHIYSENIWYIETAALNCRDISVGFAFFSKLLELYFEPSNEALTQQA